MSLADSSPAPTATSSSSALKNTVALDISALDPAFRSHAHRGIGRYVQGLATGLARINSSIVSVKTFSHAHMNQRPGTPQEDILQSNAQKPFDIRQKLISLLEKSVDFSPVFKMTMRQQCIQPLKLSALARSFNPPAKLLHFPAHMDAPAIANQPTCVTVLDLIPLVLEDLYKATTESWRFHFARFLEQRAIRRASLILCISECTAKDVVRLLKIPEEKIAVTPLAVDTSLFAAVPTSNFADTQQKFDLSAPYFLYVGGIDPRKNVSTMLEAHDLLCQREAERSKTRPLLLLAGKIKDDKQYLQVSRKIHSLKHAECVRELGFVGDADLVALYRNATAFVFPSLYEGFGFPVLEAFAAGCPVICSNNSSLPEVAGDAAFTVDPTSAENIVSAMAALLESPDLRQDLIERGSKRVPLFSWEATAAKTMDAYERYFRSK